ncbi:septum formation protein Maf [Rhodobacterales bacterium HKCCA1058]|nr:septum formation protein Maf [Rhodobacterales bacterium HKCCA1058]
MRLILGSASPRRRELLAVLGISPDDIAPPEIDEAPQKGEHPRAYVTRIAREKVAAVSSAPEDVVLCADTTVFMGRRILGKPADAVEAEAFLRLLSGRRHRVITALAARKGASVIERAVESRVKMKSLSDAEIAAYLATDDWRGKAGGYAIQGPAGAFITWISGSYPAIMGLPLAETASALAALGYPVWRQE